VDRLGVFVVPAVGVAGLDWSTHRESHVTTEPDKTLHEVGKYLRLALKGNPTITELLWLDAYDVETPAGRALIDLRGAFLSEAAVRNAYGGYARQQATKLRNRGDGSFSADTRGRTAKHGRHLLRLLRQGRELLETGHLTVKVKHRPDYFAFDSMSPEEMLDVYAYEHARFRAAKTVLPPAPDRERVAATLRMLRLSYLS